MLWIVALSAAALLALRLWRMAHAAPAASGRRHVVLLGASIGQGWKLSEWPARTRVTGVSAEALAAWQFDKSELLAEVLARPHLRFRPTRSFLRSLWSPPPRADVIILKECSAYFPGDLPAYQRQVQRWVEEIRARNIVAVLATVVPITRARAAREPDKQRALMAFNDWVRGYARRSGIPLLDLAAALETAGSGYLRDELAQSDGSHLNAQAYRILDRLLLEALFGPGAARCCDSNP